MIWLVAVLCLCFGFVAGMLAMADAKRAERQGDVLDAGDLWLAVEATGFRDPPSPRIIDRQPRARA